MIRILLLILAIVVIYKLVFGLIIPVFRTSREIKRRFRDMNQQMQDEMHGFNQTQPGSRSRQSKPAQEADPKKDYIDFEEVK